MFARYSTEQHKDLVYDVGMHKGEDADYYLKKGFRVIGFEADPDLVEHCKSRFSHAIERDMLTIVEGAITDQCAGEGVGGQTVTFYKNKNVSAWGTICDELSHRNQMLGSRTETIDVRTVNFSECLRQYGIPYYMKIDIEGADTACLRALFAFDLRPDYISIESEKVVFAKLRGEIDLLEQLGYTAFKAVRQHILPFQVEPSTPGEGISLAHRFEQGSSGPFGRDLPGKWVGKRQVLTQYKSIFFLYWLFGDYGILHGYGISRLLTWTLRRPIPGWYDTHARHSSVTTSCQPFPLQHWCLWRNGKSHPAASRQMKSVPYLR